MGFYIALLLLSLVALPAAIWFARDALVARLNPWVWAVWGFLSVALPALMLFRLDRLLGEIGLLGATREKPWGGIIGVSIIAVGWFTAYMIHKKILKPKRVATIGTSLNYVGGWLGSLIYQLFLSAGLMLVIYGRDTYRILEEVCPLEPIGEKLFRCAIASTPGALETGLMIIFVAGCLWAAIALGRKTPSAIRIAGWVMLCLFAFGFLEAIDHALEVVMSDDPRALVTKRQQDDIGSTQWVWNAIWLGYLIRSKRVREVYGRNFWGSNESSACSVPT